MDGKLIEFKSFDKIGRLFRDMVVTEKIDGTNAAIGIIRGPVSRDGYPEPDAAIEVLMDGWDSYTVYAQSRNRIITPSKDNYGFARWVHEHAIDLVTDLGPGLHFGEWWGSGIQRGYGLTKGEKRFSLFNVKRWNFQLEVPFKTAGLGTVPVLYVGEFNTEVIQGILEDLDVHGSQVVPDYDRPEGVVVYHAGGNVLFKATILNDAKPKGQVEAEARAAQEITGSGGIVLPKMDGLG